MMDVNFYRGKGERETKPERDLSRCFAPGPGGSSTPFEYLFIGESVTTSVLCGFSSFQDFNPIDRFQ